MEKIEFLGIDLGTSNCAVSYFQGESLTTADIEQMDSPSTMVKKTTLASCIYIPRQNEFGSALSDNPLVGEFAKTHGALNPERFVASAKSWLCQNRVSRNEKILPWKSTVDVKYSPIEASVSILKLMLSVDMKENVDIVITVPASFDEVARELTLKSAQCAGIEKPILLEEPQAAFYSWVANNESSCDQLEKGDVVLVCDIGGGTSDFLSY